MAVRWWSLLAVVAAAAAPTIALGQARGRSAEPTARHVRLEARQFAYAPAVIDVNLGDRVTLDFVATDVVHGLFVDGYGLSVEGDPGRTARLSFVADRPGTFRLRCSVPCGALHPFMIGKLRVRPDARLWQAIALAIPVALLGLFAWRR